MYARILVALDGSELAERVLPHAEALAGKFGAAVTLLRGTTPPGAMISGAAAGAAPVAGPVVDPTPIIEAERSDAATYLNAVATRLRALGLAVDSVQPEGPAADVIIEEIQRSRADLVMMTTHGRSGLGRLVLGSVADEVLRRAPCPVFLVRATEAARSVGQYRPKTQP